MYQPSKVLLSPGAKGQLASIGITNCMYTNHHGLLLLCVHGLCIDSSENDSDITSSPDCLSDEGIGRNLRQQQGTILHTGIKSAYTHTCYTYTLS